LCCEDDALMNERGQWSRPLCTLLVLLAATATPTLGGSHCPSKKLGQARFRTIAWVNTTCRTDANGLVGHQELYVQRGDGTPVIVSQVAIGPVPDPRMLCRGFGVFRNGNASLIGGFYTRLAVSPDGRSVVFELTDEFSLLDRGHLTDDQKGLYFA